MAGAAEFQPIPGNVTPRFAGVPSFMRLPWIDLDDAAARGVEIALIGVPFDGGTTNRPGARHGPRQLRDLSTMIRKLHPVTRFCPFEAANCADLGDAPVNPADTKDSVARIEAFYEKVATASIAPMSAGGDHLTSLPILRALAKARGPLAMIHYDAHTDLFDSYFGGFDLTHGTPFRRAVEEGVLDPKRVVQIGLRGTMYDGEDMDFGRANGVRLIPIEEVEARGVDDVMAEARAVVGGSETYVSFDIDAIDPAFAPGTGTPEIGGLTTREAQRLVRGLEGLNLVGCDLVEVSPPFDPSGATAWVGVSMMFELLCPLAAAVAARRDKAA